MGAPAARTYEHARHWAALGHDVTVICGKPNHPDGVIPERYRGTPLYRETIDGVKVMRVWLYATPNRGFFKRSISFMSFMCSSLFFGAFFARTPDLVVATSPQLLCALAGFVVATVKRRPFIFEVRDLWPKQIIDLGAVRSKTIIGLLKWVEMFLYRRARAVVTVAPATTEELARRGIPRDKLFTVTNGIDENFFVPRDRMQPLRQEQHWGDKIVVLYIGTHGLSQGLTTILDTAELLRERKDIQFVFVGTGAEREMLISRANAMRLENVQFLPMQSKERMPEFYNAADICLVPLKKRDYFRYNIPSKMFEVMACARPIVLGIEGQAREILDAAQAGIAVPPEDVDAYAEAILRLAHDPDLRHRYGASGREYVVQHYSRSVKAEEFVGYLMQVQGKSAESIKDVYKA
jgi:glycosyltransferase involved in cell wall biosynthesis